MNVQEGKDSKTEKQKTLGKSGLIMRETGNSKEFETVNNNNFNVFICSIVEFFIILLKFIRY